MNTETNEPINSGSNPFARLSKRVSEFQAVRQSFPATQSTRIDLLECLKAAQDRFTQNAAKEWDVFARKEAQADAVIIAECVAALAYSEGS